MKVAGLFLLAFAVGLLLTLVVRTLARRLGVVATPRKDRWHQSPTALLGGIGIYAAFLVGWLGFAPDGTRLVPVLAGATVLSIIGLVDDFTHLKPFVRLVIQVAVAAVVVYLGVGIRWTGYPLVDELTCIFWLVGITNALNLLDNMDGLAGGIGIISCLFLGITFSLNGQPEMVAVCAVLAGAVTGFLVFNFHPASIFMGDCGSTFLGFMLGGVSLLSDSGRSKNLAVVLLAPVLILLIPIFDTTLVTITRKVSGRPASQGGKDHTSHRLVAMGMSEVRAVVTLYVLAAASGVLALVVRLSGTESLFVLVPGFVVAIVLLGVHLGKVHVYEDKELPAQHTLITALTHFGHKRRVFEILLDVVLIAIAYYSAYLLRFETGLPAAQMQIFIRSLPLVIVFQLVSLLFGGVYSGLWRYTGLSELIAVVRASVVGVAASALAVFASNGFAGPSRAVFVLDLLLLVSLVAASRLSFRLLPLALPDTPAVNGDAKPVLIYGAGDGGELLFRELCQNPSAYNYVPIGFIDDDWRKTGRVMHGCRIFRHADLPELIRKRGVREVLVSSSKVPAAKLDHLRSLGVSTKRMSIRFE
jgi:UDP-GlcNAc:undecaprenyl-phosphate GlcNAc-1-phosphate transferase